MNGELTLIIPFSFPERQHSFSPLLILLLAWYSVDMASVNAQQVGIKVLENIKKGKKVKVGEIMKNAGYSDKTCLNPKLVTDTKSYRNTIALEAKPLIAGIAEEIERIKLALSTKVLENEEYRTLIGALNILVQNYQLLSGGATERQVFVLPSEVMERNSIQTVEQKTSVDNVQ